jgi:8-oxo-dGTP pyrophosphatase MutT (NUDIX family)
MQRVSPASLLVAKAGYFSMISTCEALREEWLRLPSTDPHPLRDLADQVAGPAGPLASGSGRAAAVGVSVTTLIPRGRDLIVMVGKRGRMVATDPGSWHVLPSGMLEPAGPQPVASESPLVTTAQRELDEELGVAIPADELEGRLEVLGIAMDLLRLRPEICLRLVLRPAEAEDAVLERAASEFATLRAVRVSRSALGAWWARMTPDLLTPAGAGAMTLLEDRL